ACWLLMPRADAAVASAGAAAATAGTGFDTLRDAGTRLADGVRQGAPDPAAAQLAIGSVLIVGGSLLLAHNLGWLHWPHWMRFETLWPLLLVALGVGLVLKSRRPPATA
ncbi:MAG TPA: DUF5668 domain-containing protein, partial [Vicinamibacteria bacterium]